MSDITTEADLTEAIQYFQTDDPPVSSAASILSGRSFGIRKITLRLNVTVDFDGRLSDTSSLASMDEYRDRDGNGSELSLSFSSAVDVEQEDDSVTVSSRDTGQRVAKTITKLSVGRWKKSIPSALPFARSSSGIESESDARSSSTWTSLSSIYTNLSLNFSTPQRLSTPIP